jgi:hypothetical protein
MLVRVSLLILAALEPTRGFAYWDIEEGVESTSYRYATVGNNHFQDLRMLKMTWI